MVAGVLQAFLALDNLTNDRDVFTGALEGTPVRNDVPTLDYAGTGRPNDKNEPAAGQGA